MHCCFLPLSSTQSKVEGTICFVQVFEKIVLLSTGKEKKHTLFIVLLMMEKLDTE